MKTQELRDRLERVLALGLANAQEDLDALGFPERNLASIVQAMKGLERFELQSFRPERADPPHWIAGRLRLDRAEPVVEYADLRRQTDRFRFAYAVYDYCSRFPLDELRRTRDRLWSNAEAGPFIIAALCARPSEALAAMPTTNPIVGRIAVRLAGMDVLRKLAGAGRPISRWAEEALESHLSPATREAYRRNRDEKLSDERVRSALWAGRRDERERAVAELGATRDPVFGSVLREAYSDPAVRAHAAVALAQVGDPTYVEEWIQEGRFRPLGILREARGLVAVARAAAQGVAGAVPALQEAGEDGRAAVLELDPCPPRLLQLWEGV